MNHEDGKMQKLSRSFWLLLVNEVILTLYDISTRLLPSVFRGIADLMVSIPAFKNRNFWLSSRFERIRVYTL